MAMWPPLLLLAGDLSVLALFSWMQWWWLAALPAAGAVILALDAMGRVVDFRHASRHLDRGRDAERVAKTYQFSWCGRVACQAAGNAVSPLAGKAVADYYRACGYRWFHIFPDNTFTRNSPFLTVRFWRVTLGGNVHAQVRLAAESDPERSVPVRPIRKAA